MTISKAGDNNAPPSPEEPIDTPRRIIVIDDDRLVLEAAAGLLKSWGYDVLTANSDRAALASLGNHDQPPTLIISDYRPSRGKPGMDVIGQLRTALRAPIPALVISGDTFPAHLRELRASGYHLLHKPVAPTALQTMLETLLKTQHAT
jgi:two-component system, sensor histidine kinase